MPISQNHFPKRNTSSDPKNVSTYVFKMTIIIGQKKSKKIKITLINQSRSSKNVQDVKMFQIFSGI